MSSCRASVSSEEIDIRQVSSWNEADVGKWAIGVIGIANTKKLKNQEVDGAALIEMATLEKDKLIVQLERYGIPGGPASKLAGEIKKLFGPVETEEKALFPIVDSLLLIFWPLLPFLNVPSKARETYCSKSPKLGYNSMVGGSDVDVNTSKTIVRKKPFKGSIKHKHD